MGWIILILFIAIVNTVAGFVIGMHLGYGPPSYGTALDVLAGGRVDIDQLAAMQEDDDAPKDEDLQDMLNDLVSADIGDMLDDHMDEAEDLRPEEEPYDEDVAVLLNPNATEAWYMNEKYVETSILKLNMAMIKSGKRATEIDMQLRQAGDMIDADLIEVCVEQLREDCESYLEELEECSEKVNERLDDFGELKYLAEEIEMANLEQSAQIETTISNLVHMQLTDDLHKGRERLLDEIGNLRVARHKLRDSQEVAFLTVARYEDRLGEIDEKLYNDELTGIRNRVGIEAMLHQWWKMNRQKQRQLAVGLIDVVGLGKINEEYGAYVGDKVLEYLGSFIPQQFDNSDIVGRFGGQRFIVFTNNTGFRKSQTMVETIRQTLAKTTFIESDKSFSVTLTTAICEISPNDSETEVIERAETTMTAAKRAGRNHSFVFCVDSLDPAPELLESPNFVSEPVQIQL